jgi:hypothetical protein
MKTKNILIIICLFCTSAGFAQNKLFDKYADMDDVTSVYISKAMFQMMPAIEQAGVNLMNLKGKIESLQLVSTEKPDKIIQMKKEFLQLVTSQHQELMRVKDGNDRVNFYSDMKGDQIKELIMLAESDSSYTAIQLIGNFTLQDIQDIAKQK